MDRSGHGGPQGPRPPFVDQERSGPPWTTLPHFPDTEIPDDSMSSLPGSEEYYPRAGDAIGDIDGFEQENSNLCEDPWAPFSCKQGLKLASWFIQSRVSKSRMNEYFWGGLGSSVLVGYSSMPTLENRLRSLDPHRLYLEWFKGQVEDSKRTLPLFYHHVLDCVRYLLGQITYQDDLVYPLRREFNPNGERIYEELHTVDWWWDVHVQCPKLLYDNVS